MNNIILHFHIVLFICSLLQLCVASPIQDLPTSMKQKTCRVNICYAIDGSGSISKSRFQQQIDFVKDTVNIVAPGFNSHFAFSAAQYGSKAYQISPLTPDFNYFLKAMKKAEAVSNAPTDIAAGLRYCTNQFSSSSADMRVIVLLGDGRHTGSEDPVQIADSFRNSGGKIILVAAGQNLDIGALQKIRGSNEEVYSVYSYLEVAINFESIVEDKCGY